jgi:hypothetical protein
MKAMEGDNETRYETLVFRYTFHLWQLLVRIASSSSESSETALHLKLSRKLRQHFGQTLFSCSMTFRKLPHSGSERWKSLGTKFGELGEWGSPKNVYRSMESTESCLVCSESLPRCNRYHFVSGNTSFALRVVA